MIEAIVVGCSMGIFACLGYIYYQWQILRNLKTRLKNCRRIPIPEKERCHEETLSDSIIIDLD